MKPVQDTYPIFEANQVLTNTHLNELFNYLDEQERLTRANLIGIGIVCGLEIDLEAPTATIHLSKGCGVTSEGYLIVEPEDVELVSYREYQLPKELDYQPLVNKSPDPPAQYPLWEMFPAGEPDTTPLAPDFLSDKAVLLFLELKKEGLRNCSPNDCDDKGWQVAAGLRRLLIKIDDLKTIIAEASDLATDLTFTDLETALLARLNLPDLRLPRYDAPNTGPATSNQVLAAFHAVFHTGKLVSNTADALTDAYEAFKPIVQGTYSTNPFDDFTVNFGFLDTAPTTTDQVRFLQYYYDFFDDLLQAYNEFRWKGVELLCACCPPEGLFPRHLMLGLLFPGSETNPSIYRHHFLASAAVSGCEERTKELRQLFQRLVEMTAQFTKSPLPDLSTEPKTDEQIRITPSKLADVPLSEKAIPYYYLQNGAPPLFHVWNAEKTRRNRANQNLSYRSDEYTPTAPAFVTDPLVYDLEPYNFLRIEGHLGKKFRNVLDTLLTLKARYRLPIEIIALRTGAFDENVSVDLSKETCRLYDLEALYDTQRAELLGALCDGVRYLYDISIEDSELPGGTPELPLLKKYAPDYRYKASTIGAWFETVLNVVQSIPYHDLSQDDQLLRERQIKQFYSFLGSLGLPSDECPVGATIYYLSKVAETLPDKLGLIVLSDLENKHADLINILLLFRSNEAKTFPSNLNQFIPKEDLIDHLDQLLFSCKLEPVKAIHEEYVRRIREVKQKQFLSFFLQKNPGIQHKAGVPIGGTFIIVYHEESKPAINPDFEKNMPSSGSTKDNTPAFLAALNNIRNKPDLLADSDVGILFGILTGETPDRTHAIRPTAGSAADKIIEAAVNALDDGTVIADFFLPYLCCSDCAPVQYVLPTPPLGLSVELGCIDPTYKWAEATLTPQGGMRPFTYQLDNQPFKQLTGKLLLAAGPHTILIRDSSGAESASQSLTVPEPLTIEKETYIDKVADQTYQVRFDISGGTPPYTADSGTIDGHTYTSEPVKSEEPISVKITDSVKCSIKSKEFKHSVCTLPCNGIARRCGFRFWVPAPNAMLKREFTDYSAEVLAFKFEFPEGNSVDLAAEVKKIIQAKVDDLNKKFNEVIQSWLESINKLIAKATESGDWLRLKYEMSTSDAVGTLWIEYFECLKFEFHIQSEYQQPEFKDKLDMTYTPKGTSIENLNITLPPFNCIRINKCDPTQHPQDLCKIVDLQLKISKQLVDNKKLTLNVTPSGTDQPQAYLWEVQDGEPTMSNEVNATFTFRQFSPTKKLIQLAAFTENGCRVVATDFVDLNSN